MPLYIIGLGLGDEKDITLKGVEAIGKCEVVWLESYTSVLAVSSERLEALYGKPVRIAYRETVESEADSILGPAKSGHVAFLVVGDPFGWVAARGRGGGGGGGEGRERATQLRSPHPHHSTPASPGRSATTHTDLLIRAQDSGIETHVIHNASIMNAAGACGLQLYSFGATISLPFFTEGWRPDSWYDKAAYNAGGGMHTLCLLGEPRA
jgi:diphthine methyl ester synthase